MAAPRPRLDVDQIVAATLETIDEDGLAQLSMRRLGRRLGVDPMAVYHHVENKQALLSLVMARLVEAMPLPDGAAPWSERVRQWAGSYCDVVVANRELVAAGLADPVIAQGGTPSTATLVAAVVDSGVPADLVESNVYLIVDFVHGSALGSAGPLRRHDDEPDPLRSAFERGLDTILVGIGAVASASDSVRQLRVVVEAADFDEAVTLYRDVLGLREAEAYEGEGDARVMILDAGRATLELANPAQVDMIDRIEVGRAVSPHIRIAFEVDDTSAVSNRLVAAGATLIAEPVETPWRSMNSRVGGAAGLQLTLFQELA